MAAYGSVGTIFSIVSKLANATAQVEWSLYRKSTTGNPDDREPVVQHPALDLINKPNSFYRRAQMIEAGQQHTDLTGEGWLILEFGGTGQSALPLEMWVVRPDRMVPVPHPTKFIAGYVYTAPTGEMIPFETYEVERLMMPNPLDPYRGLGPVQSVLTDADATRYSAEWNRNFFLNSAEPGGVIEVENTLTDPQFDQLRRRWNEQHRGVRKAHRVAILEGGTKWVPVGYSMRDMQFTELRTASRDTILESFAFHKGSLGVVDDVNRANAEAGEAQFGRWQLVPRLNRWRDAFNAITYRFYDPGETLEWVYDNPVPPDREDERAELAAAVDAFIKLVGAGVSAEQASTVAGLPQLELAGSDGQNALSPQQVGDMIQSLYLGVDKVVTWQEAREILVAAGVPLDLTEPQPSMAATGPAAPSIAAPPQQAQIETLHRQGGLPAYLASARRRADAPRILNLSDEELPDLGPMADSHAEELAALLSAWGPITDAWRADLVDQIEDIVDDGDPLDLLALELDTADAQTEIDDALTRITETAAEQMADEAAAAGTTITPQTPPADELTTMALLSAGLLASGYALSAGREAARVLQPGATGREVGQAVNSFLKTLTDAQPAEQLGAALHGAQNAGRLATLSGAPKTAVYATEVMDAATCSPCRKIDGTWLGYSDNSADMKNIRATYPNGGYAKCDGRLRCRGTVVGVWT